MVKPSSVPNCPDCGTPLKVEAATGTGLCPTCLLEIALDVTPLETELLDPGEAPTVAAGETLVAGQIQGERYRIRSLLGRGGMGEVWRAYDLKLRQDVALKSLLSEMLEDAGALEMLRQEVRVAREVVSPNVCRVFDLQEVDGQELVSMEYIDGTTLAEILKERSPLDLDEAREIASQFLAGLEAVHDAGLIHRDIKPENLMITRTGRVVVMDFGIAKALQEGKGSFAGTPAYMSPEQAQAGELDARSDVFSAGVVLAEMVAPGGVRSRESRKKLLEGLHQEVPRVADSPWAGVIRRAVAADPNDRFEGAAPLARALEEVTLRAVGEEEGDPYPGLQAFTREQAKFFFGRELEVEALWKKLRRPHLLAVIGPSGAGKSSFLRAGLIPALPEDWRAIVATPGDQPFASLARALEPELAGAEGTAELLPRFEELEVAFELLSEWQKTQGHVLLIVDQFEELFTQNPPHVRERFAELLGRLPIEADVYVLLSMRDDFLLHCQALEALAPLFSEMTPLGPPTGASLRRAIVQPALKCGYRFESESLVESMLAEVEGERGALPLLAFAARQLWRRRDRETGLLTEEEYEEIGGVGGALAQHAEATLEAIGQNRIPIVRELFRNLVTAQGTRAVRDRDDLLSVFEGLQGHDPEGDRVAHREGRVPATEVLDALIDARLLTSYEVEAEAAPTRIEIVHESLLSAWPRLVRWRTQDAEGAQLRDELRNQARLWEQHDRSDDYLWTGAAYLDYLAWRDRYPGGLTAIEEAFGAAMTRHAERRRRRRRVALGAAFVVLLVVLVVVGGLWQRADAAARRAVAAHLLSLGQFELEEHPTAALAYAVASLERADTPEVRLLALEALWRGPPETRLPAASQLYVEFSPDGRWLATQSHNNGTLLWPSDGGAPKALEGSEFSSVNRISPRGDLLAHDMELERRRLGLWSIPGGRLLRDLELPGDTWLFHFSPDGDRLFTNSEIRDGERGVVEIRSWPVDNGVPEILARLDVAAKSLGTFASIDPTGSVVAWIDGPELHTARLSEKAIDWATESILLHGVSLATAGFDEQGQRLALVDVEGTVQIWSLAADPPELERRLTGRSETVWLRFDRSGSMLAASDQKLWDLTAPPGARPLELKRAVGAIEGDLGVGYGVAFDPQGNWLATSHIRSVSFWPLVRPYPRVIEAGEPLHSLVLTPDGKSVIAAGNRSVRRWPLDGSGNGVSILYLSEQASDRPHRLALAADGSLAAIGTVSGRILVQPLDGSRARELSGLAEGPEVIAVSPDGRFVAAGGGRWIEKEKPIVHVWDLETGEDQIVEVGCDFPLNHLEFSGQGHLWIGKCGYDRWDVSGERPNLVEHRDQLTGGRIRDVSSDGRRGLVTGNEGRLWLDDLGEGTKRVLEMYGDTAGVSRFDPTNEIIASGDREGAIRVGLVGGGEPHLFLGHEGRVGGLALDFSPDGKWIVSGGEDGTIRFWPMPDLSKPPLHTLPRAELLAKLETLTNLRVIQDSELATGWKLEIGPFPGWDEVPTW